MGTDRQTDGQTDRRTDGQTQVTRITLRPKRPRVKKVWQTDRQTDRKYRSLSCLVAAKNIGSVVQYYWSCTSSHILMLGCLWSLVFVLNNILTLGILHSAISHLPRCFCPWTFFKNIRLNMVSSDPFMSHLATQLGYSTGEFQALQLIVLAAFGVVD